jgi:GNAT superfamily N-acetyltransferase
MQRQLANGLVLRSLSEGFASDREQLPQFYAAYNGEGEPEWAAQGLAHWGEDLMNNHPRTTLDDIFVVVDPARDNLLVSATLLIPQTWRYEGILIAVGRPELVATHPEYRGQGLVRTLFEVVHERSAALGHQLQVITGIPYFYRQFGYTMALDLGGRATLPLAIIDDLAPDAKPAYTLRPATLEDIGDLAAWHDYMASDRLITEVRTPEIWCYELEGRQERSMRARSYQIIVNSVGEGVGYVELSRNSSDNLVYCEAIVVGEQASYLETFEDVIRGIRQWAVEQFGKLPPLLILGSGAHSALYTLFDRTFGGDVYEHSYKWYIRIPEPIAFLRHIQPVLEQRLERSGAHRYTGEFKIGFYNLTGISLKFERGRIVEIAPVTGKDGYEVSFPWHLFWNVVFGANSTKEINAILPDVWAGSGKSEVLMDTLFPKKSSWIEGLA